MPESHPNLSDALRAIYSIPGFQPRARTDDSDGGFIAVSLIERSIALLSRELKGTVIDVGCGERPYEPFYFSHLEKMIGCDFDGKRGPVDFECSADNIPMPNESVDGVLCTEVLEHVPEPLAVWREFHRLLRPQGKVLLATPMYWPSHEEPYDFYRYPQFGLRRLAKESGFEILGLYPRGGVWAFLGQANMHGVGHYLKCRWQRRWWNRFWLRLDRSRCNPGLTLGWTILAQKV
jgi:SAM-dependent methyltransferase